MSCCGKKRGQWKEEYSTAVAQSNAREIELEAPVTQNSLWFEYTGNSSLKITGAYSQTVYHFEAPGSRIEVVYSDSFALRAEPFLKLSLAVEKY